MRSVGVGALAFVLGSGLCVGCEGGGGSADAGVDSAAMRDAGPPIETIGPAERPARLAIPSAYDGTTPLPLAVFLHGYSVNSALEDAYLGASAIARERGVYLILPEGTEDSVGSRFWNATDGCCNFDGSTVDDVAYLRGLIDEVVADYPVDETRIYVLGHSNGGFMSYRMACDAADRITAISALSASEFEDPTRCAPSQPVAVLHLHGDADTTIPYEGGAVRGAAAFPGAVEVVTRWAERDGCDPSMPTDGAPLDLTSMGTDETLVRDWTSGCTGGTSVSLWTLQGEGHIPGFRARAYEQVFDWLLAHHR